ncbi:Flagellar motor switch protein FliG [Anaerohalosphaera lusitana]|uniref:Flagellar motor switch protein FliG n=1 Tax=Anaerohalosphaera lusitana TaxID=1936003 RepID=A0A1U9NGF7_9BACT|nr:FliG C-terminal domain-containing protein [Anaerohalosphaera lusitana]AQT66895.1 Flagellar motor switch protein FliG [Anaerohalosphaera lusitana]
MANVNGVRKIAMLLLGLDAVTATELMKGLNPEEVQEIAMELAQLDASDQRDPKEEARIAREFHGVLQKKVAQRFNVKKFLNEALVNILGSGKAEEVRNQVMAVTQRKDPFINIRSATTDELVLALEGQHPQTTAAVLGELAPNKCQEVLSHLDEQTRRQTVRRMATLDQMTMDMKHRIAGMVNERLNKFKGEVLPEGREQTLRRLAVVLSGLDHKLRDELVGEINKEDEESCTMVKNLMVTWEDIPSIADRSLQECLRNVDVGKMAVALFEADEDIAQKIRANMSGRAVSMLDEEISLMQEPMEQEVIEARDEVVQPLREANEEGTLRKEK